MSQRFWVLFLGTVLGLLTLVTALGLWWWRRGGPRAQDTVRRVARNSLSYIAAQLLNKGVDFGFAVVVLHYLGREGNGRYALAALTLLYLQTVSDFGMATLVTREVAREPDLAPTFLPVTVLFRWGLTFLAFPLALGLAGGYALLGRPLHPDTVQALLILTLTLFPAHLAQGISSLFAAHERMEIPAGIALVTNLVKTLLGIAALVLGGRVVALAWVALAATFVNALIFWGAFRAYFPTLRLRWRWDGATVRRALPVAFPLMLNSLLLVLFFRMDYYILQFFGGEGTVGSYDAAYKFINTTTFIPAYFSLALFPILSRRAGDPEGVWPLYRSGLKVLLSLAFPMAAGVTLLSTDLIRFLGGEAFLPEGAVALSILIWYLPLNYVNALTQYLLIALDRQAVITLSFGLTALFNGGLNLLLIPFWGVRAAAVLTILSELVLFLPFLRVLRRDLGRTPPLLALSWRPALAAAGMYLACLPAYRLYPWLAVPVGVLTYPLFLWLLGGIGPEEREAVRRLLGR